MEDVLETAEFLDIPLVSRMHCFLTMPWESGCLPGNTSCPYWRRVPGSLSLERFVEISKEGEFSELPAEMLGMVLASDQLSCEETRSTIEIPSLTQYVKKSRGA